MKVCPECGGTKFVTTGIQRHDWIVDGDGNFIDDKGCFDAQLGGGSWECENCQALFEGSHELKAV